MIQEKTNIKFRNSTMKCSIFIFSLLSASLCMAFSPARAISQDSIDAIVASVNAEINSGACLEFLDESGPNLEYHNIIRNLYIKDRGYSFYYYVIPNYIVEYSIGYNPKKGVIEYRYTPNKYDLTQGSDRIILTDEAPVSRKVAKSLSRLISAATEPAQLKHFEDFYHLNDSIGWGFIRENGDIYEFHDKDGNAAQCWSPSVGNSKELVQIMETVCQLVEDGKSKEISSLKPDIDRLTKKFGK